VTFADDTAVMAVGENIEEATAKLQQAINAINSCSKQWRVILNEIKSVHVNFTNRKVRYIEVTINGHQIPHSNTAKYLGMTLDSKLRWKEHEKRKQKNLTSNTEKSSGSWVGRRSYPHKTQ
jgi:hypothetical protein